MSSNDATQMIPQPPWHVLFAGKLSLVTKTSDNGVLLEVWGQQRLLRELLVPKGLHGPIVNDNWFSRGAAWSPDESKIAYVAEVRGGSLGKVGVCWRTGGGQGEIGS